MYLLNSDSAASGSVVEIAYDSNISLSSRATLRPCQDRLRVSVAIA
jgi:hypothetical protein